ncbi:MAG: uracil-DNA glycosylase [Candidatus Liptonbacteria bacterium]|nr:uracil-DNA glycosylase [Candidatus Liptonbacteria bacterium]
MTKTEALHDLAQKLAADSALPLRSANLVFGEGDPDATVVFVGEAPGQKEDELGRPFVGRAGQLLDRLIVQVGWRREAVYITNIVKRRPPENRDPLPEEISAYQPYLTRQLAILAPLLVAPLGRFAMNFFLPEAKISRDHGQVFRIGGQFVVPLYHPAAALRATQVLEDLTKDFLRLPKIIEKCRAIAAGTATPSAAPPASPSPRSQRKLF